jgi:Holliday junction resolvasome RuvABC DNA-binding subunit
VGAANETAPVAPARAPVGAVNNLDAAILRTQAKAALVGLGWKPAIAHQAIAAAAAAQGAELTLERLIFESLRRCPTPKA